MRSFYKGDAGVKLAAVKKNSRSTMWSAAFAILLLTGITQTVKAQNFAVGSSASFPTPTSNVARMAIADFDNDGDDDILFQTGANGTPFNFARNAGNGTFTTVAQSASPFSAVTLPDMGAFNLYKTADFDNDGDVDVWVPIATTTGLYFRNDGGTFSAQSSGSFPTTQFTARNVVADFDGDGDADILSQVNGNGTAFQYSRNGGNATFTLLAQGASPFAGLTLPDMVAINQYRAADFDGDNDIDLWSTANGASGSYFRNDGATFSSQSSATFPAPANAGRSVEGDFDTDGDVDILFQNPSTAGSPFFYARSNGDGTFTTLAQASSPFAGLTLPDLASLGQFKVHDFDNDNDFDLWSASTTTTGTHFQQAGAPPTITSTSPANNANGVLVTANIVLNFSEIVNKNVGTIYIRRVSDNALHMAINVTSAMVTGGGTSTITINPSWDLQQLTQYYVTVDAEAFADAGGAVFAGINNSTTLRFTTTTPLPAQWTGVNASVVNNKIKVDWSTTNESNASRYEVERSVNGISFTSIGSVAAANTPGDHQYSFEDANVTKGSTYFYRIKLVDIDGKQSRSAVVSAALSGGIKQGLMIHGNPRGGALQATIFAVRTQKAAIRLISTSGQVVAQQDVPLQTGENRIKLPGADLPAGTYILQVTTTEGVMQQKVLKQ